MGFFLFYSSKKMHKKCTNGASKGTLDLTVAKAILLVYVLLINSFLGCVSIFSYLCGATGKSNPQGKKVVHLHKKIWTIFKQRMDNPVWYVSMPQGIVHIGRICLLLCPCPEGLVE